MIFLTSCGVSSVQPSETGTEEKTVKETVPYSMQQMLMIVLSQKERIRKTYTDQVWNTALNPGGRTYSDVFTDEMQEFFCEMATMNRLAQEKKIKLTTAEEEQIRNAGTVFYESSVQNADILKNLSEEDTAEMFRQYYIAKKTKDALISESHTEVSDSEAKVIDIQKIVAADSDTANIVRVKAQAGADFYGLAQTYSREEDISVKAGRGDLKKPVEDAAFSLEDGEISGIIQADGKFYILKCISSYDREETEIRKKTIEKERLKTTVHANYEDFASRCEITMDHVLWNRVLEKSEEPYSGQDFFETLKEETSDEGV